LWVLNRGAGSIVEVQSRINCFEGKHHGLLDAGKIPQAREEANIAIGQGASLWSSNKPLSQTEWFH